MANYYYLKRIGIKVDSFSIIPFKNKKVIIGRAQSCDFIIPDILISRCHAVIESRHNIWHLKNMSSSGITLNNKLLAYNSEEVIKLGDIIQFGPSPDYLYRFNMKEVREDAQSESNVNTECQSLLTQQHILQKKLEQSIAAKDVLLNEKQQLQLSFENEKKSLKLDWSGKLIDLEKIHQDGLTAHMTLLQEKASLADQLKNEVKEMEQRVEENKLKLEDQLKREESVRQTILEEKELITAALLAEKNALKEELKVMEAAKAEFAIKMEHEAQSLQEMVEIRDKVEQKQQQEAESLKAERVKMQQRLQEVENCLEEKTELTSALKIELGKKALAEEELWVLLEEREALKKRLDDACKNNEEVEKLKESLRDLENQKITLEAQKLSLEAGPSFSSMDEREKIVTTVTDVIENEFQCAICNELLVTAMTLNCSHTFCKYCIDKWKERKKECPNCRSKITTETRALVVDNFIDRIVDKLSDSLKVRRKEFITERENQIAAERAAAEAKRVAAEAARVAAQQRRGRGRNRRGNARGRNATRSRLAYSMNRPFEVPVNNPDNSRIDPIRRSITPGNTGFQSALPPRYLAIQPLADVRIDPGFLRVVPVHTWRTIEEHLRINSREQYSTPLVPYRAAASNVTLRGRPSNRR